MTTAPTEMVAIVEKRATSSPKQSAARRAIERAAGVHQRHQQRRQAAGPNGGAEQMQHIRAGGRRRGLQQRGRVTAERDRDEHPRGKDRDGQPSQEGPRLAASAHEGDGQSGDHDGPNDPERAPLAQAKRAANGANQIRLGVAGEDRRLGQQQPNMGAGREPEANPRQLDVA